MTIDELIEKLKAFPGNYYVTASGDYMGDGDIYVVSPEGLMSDYIYESLFDKTVPKITGNM